MNPADLALVAVVLALLVALGLLALRDLPRDPLAVLTIFVATLFLIPARLVIVPLGAIGQPALLVALAALGWWVAGRLNPRLGFATGRQPVREVMLAYSWFILLAYAVAYIRPLTQLEVNSSNRNVILFLGLVGVALLTADGLQSRADLDRMLRRLTVVGSVVALIGIIQFQTGFDPVAYIRIPGLSFDASVDAVGSRSIFNRPYGTTLHPIEFGVVCAMLLPLALHYAFYAGGKKVFRWGVVGLLAAAVPMSLSRSGILCVMVAFLLQAVGWDWRRRFNAGVAAVAFTSFMWAAVPGLIGTLRSLFVGADTDPSIVARRERVPRVLELVRESPWLGRGFGTYTPEDYFLLDNQWYETTIETGLIGVGVVVILLLVCAGTARGARHRSKDAETRHLGQTIAASIIAAGVALATFDAFFYRIFTGILFLLCGAAGALWRVTRSTHDREPVTHGEPARVRSRAALTAPGD